MVSRLQAIPGRLRTVATDGAFYGALAVLAVVTSHYDGLDLPAIGEGFAAGRSDEDIDALEEAAVPTARALTRLVNPEQVLKGQDPE